MEDTGYGATGVGVCLVVFHSCIFYNRIVDFVTFYDERL